MRRIDVFFYGLFMDEALLHERGVRPGSMQAASVRGFQLRIGRHEDNIAAAEDRTPARDRRAVNSGDHYLRHAAKLSNKPAQSLNENSNQH